MRCERKGCSAEAKCILGINVPTQGVAIDLHTPLHMAIGFHLCASHFDEIDLAELLTDQLKEIIRAQARMSVPEGREPLPPDFARAFKNRVSFNSVEYRVMARGRARN
jgi:hypothetical protein